MMNPSSATHTTLPCPGCQHTLRVRYSVLGGELKCRHCRQRFHPRVNIDCPGCKRSLAVRPECFGSMARCKSCSHTFRLLVPVRCPQCRQGCGVSPSKIGRHTRCTACTHRFRVGPVPEQSSPLKWFQAAVFVADHYRTAPDGLDIPVQAAAPVLEQAQVVQDLTDKAAAAEAERDLLRARCQALCGDAEMLLARQADLERLLAEATQAQAAADRRWQRALEDAHALWEIQASTQIFALQDEAEQEVKDLERRLARHREQAEAERQDWQQRQTEQEGERVALLAEVQRLRAEAEQHRQGQDGFEQSVRDLTARLNAEAERLAGELAEAQQGREQEARTRQDLEARLRSLDAELLTWRAEAGTLGQRLQEALEVSQQQRSLAGQLEADLAAQRQTTDAARGERDRARAEVAGLQIELQRAFATLQTLTAQRDQFAQEASNALAALEQLRQTADEDRARLGQALSKAQQEQEAMVPREKELLEQVGRLNGELTTTRDALSCAEALLGSTRGELEAARQDQQAQRERAAALEHRLLAYRDEVEAERLSWRQQQQLLQQSLEKQIQALQAEVARLQAELAARQQPGSAPARPAVDDAFWELVGAGGLPLPLAPVAPARMPVRTAQSLERMQARLAADLTAVITLLRAVGGEEVPPKAVMQDALEQIGNLSLSAVVEAAGAGDAVVRRGGARACSWRSHNARKQRQLPHALASAEQAVRLFRQLAQETPRSHTVRAELTAAYLTQAQCQRHAGQPQEALRSLRAAREAAESLVRDQPRIAPYQRLLARCLSEIGLLLFTTGRTDEATGVLREAIRYMSEVVRHSPQAANYAADLNRLQKVLARCLSGAAPRAEEEVMVVPS